MKESFHIKSDLPIDPSQAVLLLVAGAGHCSFGILDHLSKELVEFGYYVAEQEEEDVCKKLFEQNDSLSRRYFQSAIVYDVPETVQVPSAYYKYEDAQLHLKAVYGVNGQSVLVSENLPEWNLYNVYRVPSDLHGLLSQKLSSGKYWHAASIQLKSNTENTVDMLLINFKIDGFSVVVLKGRNLQLVQNFPYAAPEDVLYYLLKICQQFSLSQREIRIILSGLIEKDSAICRELFKYFIYVDFELLPAGIKLAAAFSNYPDHYFSSICKLAICVS